MYTDVIDPPQTTTPSTLAVIQKADIDMQISTAKRYPRNVTQSLAKAKSEALLSPGIAESCFYVLPRSGKQIVGPSVRLAEIMVKTWGNLRVAARIIDEGPRFVTAQAVCHDLESNSCVSVEKTRRITDKNGNRYNDDMIGVTMNAASSVAFRDSVFRIVPRSYVDEIYEECRKCVAGDVKSIESRRAELVKWFAKKGASEAEVCELAGVKGLADIGIEQLTDLRFLASAIDKGDVTVKGALQSAREDSDGDTAQTVGKGVQGTKERLRALHDAQTAKTNGNGQEPQENAQEGQGHKPVPPPPPAPENETTTKGEPPPKQKLKPANAKSLMAQLDEVRSTDTRTALLQKHGVNRLTLKDMDPEAANNLRIDIDEAIACQGSE